MSVSYSVLVKKKNSLESLKNCLQKFLNSPLEKVDSTDYEIYSTEVLGTGVSLFASVAYEDDAIEFSEYDYEVSFDYLGKYDKAVSDKWLTTLSIIIANLISRELQCECIATENLHTILQKFPLDLIPD